MNINFAPADEAFLEKSVQSGIYSNKTEAVRDAVRRMREREEFKRDRLLAAIRIGQEDIEAGRMMPYTNDLIDRITEEAIRKAENSEMVFDPEVTGEGL
jgi:antitoxin ParD1/3/4